MGKKITLSLVIFSAVACIGTSAWASGMTDTYGVGTRAIALGGAFTAVADDFSAAFYNPAGLGQTNGHHFSLEYLYTMPDIDVKTSNGEDLVIYDQLGDVRTDPTEGTAGHGLDLGFPVIGLILDINDIAKLPVNVQLGAAISLPEDLDIAYRIRDYPPDQPHFIRYGDDIDRILLAVGVGVEAVKDVIYVGGGVQAMLHGPGSFYVDGLSLTEANVVSQSEFGALLEFEPTFGLLVTPFDKKLKIGFSWRDAQELDLGVIPIVSPMVIGGLVTNVNMNLDIKAFYTPEEYSIGVAFDLDPVLVSLEVNKQLWSNYAYSTTDSYHYFGSPDFKDTYNYRVGVEYKLNPKTSLMAGYFHQPSPVPDQSGKVSNYIDMDKDCFSLGASYMLDPPFGITKEPVKLGLTAQYQMLDDVSVTNKDGVTGISWEDEEDYTVEGNALAFGASVSVSWK